MLIEKPMALTNARLRCDRRESPVASKGVKVCVGHTGLFYEPVLSRGREIVERER